MPSNQEIVDYYKFSKLDYRLYNGSYSNLSMHYGIWDYSTRSHRDALMNENRVVADIASINATDRVIDLGCGYGATAVWLALNRGCRVIGITLSREQVTEATRLATKLGVDRRVTFQVADFHGTKFRSEQFDAAISIESFSHSARKPGALREAFRILKPGGRLVIADGYLARPIETLTQHEREIARVCFEGVHVPPLPERRKFEAWMLSTGFSGVRWYDKTSSILPSAAKVNRLGRMLLPISRLASLFGLRSLNVSHIKAFIHQYEGFRDGMGVYGIFCGTKPVALSHGIGGPLAVLNRSTASSANNPLPDAPQKEG